MPLLLLSKSQPLTLGCDLVLGANLKAAASMWSQSLLCDHVFFCQRQKRHHPPAPLLLLSKSNPLLWASIWYRVQQHLYRFKCAPLFGKTIRKAGHILYFKTHVNRSYPLIRLFKTR